MENNEVVGNLKASGIAELWFLAREAMRQLQSPVNGRPRDVVVAAVTEGEVAGILATAELLFPEHRGAMRRLLSESTEGLTVTSARQAIKGRLSSASWMSFIERPMAGGD